MKKNKIFGAILFIIGLLIVLGLAIWVGFPAPQGFDRLAICYVGFVLGIFSIIAGVCLVYDD